MKDEGCLALETTLREVTGDAQLRLSRALLAQLASEFKGAAGSVHSFLVTTGNDTNGRRRQLGPQSYGKQSGVGKLRFH